MIRAALVLLLLTVVAYWPQATSPLWHGTEGRRVQIAQEMAASGELMVPTLGHEPTVAKPPLHYWALVAATELSGPSLRSMRLPSLLGLWLCACAAYFALRDRFGRRAGLLAGAGILCSPVILLHCGYAEIDPLFAVLTAISLLWLSRGVAYGGRSALVAAGLCGGLALMTKGPPYFMFLAGALLVWGRHRRLGGIGWYLLPLLVLPGIYYGLLYWGPWFDAAQLTDVAGRESLGRVLTYEWKHVVDAPMHLCRAALISLPFGLWTLAEFRGRHEARLQPMEIQLRMCVGAALGSVILLTFFPGRAVRYLLPAVMLFVCAVAPAVAAFTRNPAPPQLGQLLVVRALGLVAAVVLLALPWLPFPLPGTSTLLALGLAAAPLVVSTRPHLCLYALAVPVLAVWTVLPDRSRLYEHGIKSVADTALLLREEVDRRSAVGDLSTFGHFTAEQLLSAGIDAPGDELRARQPTSRWLLIEDADGIAGDEDVPGYVGRVRIRARRLSRVLAERDGP